MACVWLVSLLFVGALGVPIPVSDSFLVSPEQIHLALGATPAEMVVSWVTWEDGTEPGQSVVRFGVDPTNLTLSATGSWTRYKSYCSGPSTPQYEYTSGFIHNVRLTNLTSSTQYHYQIQSSNSSAASSILNFFTQPDVGTFFKKPVNLIVAGDLGQTSDSQSTIAHMLQDTQDSVVLIAGDMSYADCDHKRWDTWGKMIEPLASTRAIMVAAGNHEIEKDLVQNVSFLGYKKRFVMPAAQPEQDSTYIDRVSDCTPSVFFGDYNYGNSFYSFELAGVHVIVLNSYTRSNPSSPQYTWLESDLVAVNRDDTPWIVVMMHCPWYNSNVDHQLEPMTVAMRTSMEATSPSPLLLLPTFILSSAPPTLILPPLNVPASCSGLTCRSRCSWIIGSTSSSPAMCTRASSPRHSSPSTSYERTNPVSNDTVHVPGGAPVYINLGDGGNREGHSRTFLVQPRAMPHRAILTMPHRAILTMPRHIVPYLALPRHAPPYSAPLDTETNTSQANSPPWSAFRNGMDFGHTRLVVYNETHALHEWHSDNKPEGNVSDSTWLINDPKAWGKEHY